MLRPTEGPEPVAIIGMACRFPGGVNTPEQLWQLLVDGKSAWSEIPADRYTWKSFYHPHPDAEGAHNQVGGGYIDRDLASFDAAFFNIPAVEADGLDPQQRIQLETAYEALENAGLPLDSIKGSRTSVHVATVSRDYDRNAYRDPQDLAKYQLTGCGEAITSGRVSYTFDLRGPCFSLDTGCSGSLVGLHLAVQGLRSRETDMALVGGTNLLLSPDMTIAMSKLHMLNDDGKCYAFDSRGKGYARSEGVSTIVLKRLSDAVNAGDPIRAVIRNTGINQDGKTNGIMLPNSQAQEDLMRSIHLNAGLDPSLTTYVEAHGTGTQAGDSAEIKSIANVFCNGATRDQPLYVGSVKANLGHCESASGLAGLIKTVLVLEKGVIPATPGIIKIKDGLDLQERNIQIPQQLKEWPALAVRRAAINSFGYGGTNVAAILDGYQPTHGRNGLSGGKLIKESDGRAFLFAVSAKSSKSLMGNLENLKQWVSSQSHLFPDQLHQLAYTLSARRSKFSIRTSFLASTQEEFLTAVSSAASRQPERAASKPKVMMIFTGQGAQWYAMGRQLLHMQSRFAKSLQESEAILRNLGAKWSLFEMLSRDQGTSQINESEISQPATTALQIALVDLLDSFSVRPDSVIGHSSGEIAAAYAAGALSHAAALCVSFHRSQVSRLVKQVISTPGGMLVTSLTETDAYKYIESVGLEKLSLACINSPSSTTISGDLDAVHELKEMLEGKSIMAKVLAVDVAYHSHHMKAVADQYRGALQGLDSSETRKDVQFFSSVTGELKNFGFGPDYWVQNLVSTVRFPDALMTAYEHSHTAPRPRTTPCVIVEVGPHSALAGPVKQTMNLAPHAIDHKYLSALVRGKDAHTTVLILAGKLFEFGLQIDLEAVNEMNGGSTRKTILDLPPYAWDYSNRYWHESRLSKEYRFRKHPYHDLLGLRVIGSTPLEPLWRNILSVDAQPWLAEHIIDKLAILPGSSFVTMAMEAARQLNDERGARRIKRFHLRKVKYFKPIRIPTSPGKVEVMISLSSPSSTSQDSLGWEKFQVTSSADAETWSLNCVGQIRLEFESTPNEVDGGHEEMQTLSNLRDRFTQIDESCTQPIEHTALYEEMRRNGVNYGSNFATIKKLRLGECLALGEVVIPNVAQCMPAGYQQPHTIHPATFDALMHIVLPLYFRHCTAGTAMLTSIEEISVAADMATTAGCAIDVCAALTPTGPRSGSVDVIAFQEDSKGPIPVVVLRGQRFQGIANSSSFTPKTVSRPLHSTCEPLKLTFTTPGLVSSLCFVEDQAAKVAVRPDEVEIKAMAFGLDITDANGILGRSDNSTVIGECAGLITAVGSDLTHCFQIGERVCAWNTSSAFASRSRVKSSFVQRIPDSWSFQFAAAVPQNMSVAYHALWNCAQVKEGQTVLINNAGGALGQALVLVANLLGLRVVATVKFKREKEALQSVRGTQPAHILHSEDSALTKALLRLTKGAGVDVVVNTSLTASSADLAASVKAFGTFIDLHQEPTSLVLENRAIKYSCFDASQLLRHLPSVASSAFKEVMSLLPTADVKSLMPVIAVPISNLASGFNSVQSQKNIGKTVLLAGDDAVVSVKEAVVLETSIVNVDRIIQAVKELALPRDQEERLLSLIEVASMVETNTPSTPAINGTASSGSKETICPELRLAAVSSLREAREIVLDEQIRKMSSLVSVDVEQLDPQEPLSDLGLDSLIAIEFKNWLAGNLGADLRVHDILDADGLEALANLVVQRSKFVSDSLPEEPSEPSPRKYQTRENEISKASEISGAITLENVAGSIPDPSGISSEMTTAGESNGIANGTVDLSRTPQSQSSSREYRFTVNKCPKYPLPPLDTLLEAYLNGVTAFATPEELKNTVRLIEEFKTPGSKGWLLYNRAAARYADPNCENWEYEVQLGSRYLNRRGALIPWSNFWFAHPLSKRQHSQAERAALLAFTASQYKLKLEAGLLKPMVLNEQELTNAYLPYIFSTVREPHLGCDKIERYPGAEYCVVLWRGHAFKLNLFVGDQPAGFEDFCGAFLSILGKEMDRSEVGIFTSANRDSWAEARKALKDLNPVNAATIATIEASAFVVALDEAAPLTATERAKQFNYGGQKDAANRWQDKSIQFIICSNGVSGVVGEHTMIDALNLDELIGEQVAAIHAYDPLDDRAIPRTTSLTPVHLPLTTNTEIDTRIIKVQGEYMESISGSEHAYMVFDDYGAAFLRAQKLSPKSVFQMIVQLAALATFGYMVPCWETVNQAHYHLGRVDNIQVVVPAVATFVQAAANSSIPLSKRRALLANAIRAHVKTKNKSAQNLEWERAMSALRDMVETPEELPELFRDPVNIRVQPELLNSHCFEARMMEKGCMWPHPDSIWLHHEVYDQNVFFSVVTRKANRATRFCENFKEAAALVKQIILA